MSIQASTTPPSASSPPAAAAASRNVLVADLRDRAQARADRDRADDLEEHSAGVAGLDEAYEEAGA